MNLLIITGGSIGNRLKNWLYDRNFDVIIAVDAGLEIAEQIRKKPNYIVGDFDTVSSEILERYISDPAVEIRRFQPEKDATDTQIAYELAMELMKASKDKENEAVIAGGIGSRFDHSLANVLLLEKFEKNGINAYCMDDNNCISVHRKSFELVRKNVYGKYVSFHSLSDMVSNLTLEGFKYSLKNHILVRSDSLCVSNEMNQETARVIFSKGVLLMVQAMD